MRWSQQYGDVKANLNSFVQRTRESIPKSRLYKMPGHIQNELRKGMRLPGDVGSIASPGLRHKDGWKGGATRTNKHKIINDLRRGRGLENTRKIAAAGKRGAGFALGFGKGGFLKGGGALGLGFTLFSAAQGYQEGGMSGAISSVGHSAIEFALFDMAFKSAGIALGPIAGPVGIVAAVGVAGYMAADAIAGMGRGSKLNEFGGSMEAFNTRGAHTMRQRAVQEIARSHTSSRVVLGQEAQLMHLR